MTDTGLRIPIAIDPRAPLPASVARIHAVMVQHSTPCLIACERCGRGLATACRYAKHPIPSYIFEPGATLGATDFCRWCARPITAAGEALSPLTGYLAIARTILGERRAGRLEPIRTVA